MHFQAVVWSGLLAVLLSCSVVTAMYIAHEAPPTTGGHISKRAAFVGPSVWSAGAYPTYFMPKPVTRGYGAPDLRSIRMMLRELGSRMNVVNPKRASGGDDPEQMEFLG
ncbi:hypothetical protein BV898_16170 [Hypsibius exemplaris]|uniref:Uncharacterized protein n=1 Tax=Hypsibius exemplaris TaxID=2072580 RepID=A0A9X6RLB6_HYPEX|nr:hypothetical protein BV898_16170 [Hypsibius exemplaris]